MYLKHHGRYCAESHELKSQLMGLPVDRLLDEVLNLLPAGLSERLGATEIDGVGLDQFRVELVLLDDLAQTVADFVGIVPISSTEQVPMP